MAIKRGVALYSYQQSQFFKKLDWKAQIREVREGLGTDGIEIINEQLIRHYPFPSEEFLYDWRSYMARYNMQAVTMDVYLDVHQFRDHVMTHREAAEHLKNDIRLAAKMGFKNIRTLVLVPIDVIEAALPTAEKYNVKIGKEIHAPWPIKPGNFVQPKKGMAAGINFRAVDEIVELRERTGSRYVGLVPDFGIFQHSPSDVAIAYVKSRPELSGRYLRKVDEEEQRFIARFFAFGVCGIIVEWVTTGMKEAPSLIASRMRILLDSTKQLAFKRVMSETPEK